MAPFWEIVAKKVNDKNSIAIFGQRGRKISKHVKEGTTVMSAVPFRSRVYGLIEASFNETCEFGVFTLMRSGSDTKNMRDAGAMSYGTIPAIRVSLAFSSGSGAGATTKEVLIIRFLSCSFP